MDETFDENDRKFFCFCGIHISILQRLVSLISVLLNIFLLIDGCYHNLRFYSLYSFFLYICCQLSIIVVITVADCGESPTACRMWIVAMCVQLFVFFKLAVSAFPSFVVEDLRWHDLIVKKELEIVVAAGVIAFVVVVYAAFIWVVYKYDRFISARNRAYGTSPRIEDSRQYSIEERVEPSPAIAVQFV